MFNPFSVPYYLHFLWDGLTLSYNSEHPADPAHWLDYVAFISCLCFLVVTLLAGLSTIVFSLQKRNDILLKCPPAQLLMYTGALLQVSATMISYLPLWFLQNTVTEPACVVLDYWMTVGGTALWCIGYCFSLSNNILGCMAIVERKIAERHEAFPSTMELHDPKAVHQHQASLGSGLQEPPSSQSMSDFSVEDETVEDLQEPQWSNAVLDDVDLELGDLPSSGAPRWTADAAVWARGNMLMRRFGCAWRLRPMLSLKVRTVSGRIMGITTGAILGFLVLFLLICLAAQTSHASRPVVGANTTVILCESHLDFKFATVIVMVSYVALCWVLLLLLRSYRMVPRFCASEYMRMLAMLTGLFVVTLVINFFGATRYFWGRFIYIELMLMLYTVAWYCLCGRAWKDVLRRHRISDKQILWQLGLYSEPKTFCDIFTNEMQREFLYRDFAAWMINTAQPAFVPNSMRLGDAVVDAGRNMWDHAEVMPLHGSSPELASTHFLVFPNRLLVLFEDAAKYIRDENGQEVLPARLRQDFARGIGESESDRLSRTLDEERYSTGLARIFITMRRSLSKLFRREDGAGGGGGSDSARYQPEHYNRVFHASDSIRKNFLHARRNFSEQEQLARQLAASPHNADLLVQVGDTLPAVSCTDQWFNTHMLDAQKQEDPEFFRYVYLYLIGLFDRYYFPLFMRNDRAKRKMTEIKKTSDQLKQAVVEDKRHSSDNPFDDEDEDGLSMGVDHVFPPHLHKILGYWPPAPRRRNYSSSSILDTAAGLMPPADSPAAVVAEDSGSGSGGGPSQQSEASISVSVSVRRQEFSAYSDVGFSALPPPEHDDLPDLEI